MSLSWQGAAGGAGGQETCTDGGRRHLGEVERCWPRGGQPSPQHPGDRGWLRLEAQDRVTFPPPFITTGVLPRVRPADSLHLLPGGRKRGEARKGS